jgi:hypothetical protein
MCGLAVGPRFRGARSADSIGPTETQVLDKPANVMGGICTVRPDEEDHVSGRGNDSKIEGRRGDASWILDQADPGGASRDAANDVRGTVLAHAIHDQDLQCVCGVVQPEERLEARTDVAFLVPAGNDEGCTW